MKRARSLKISTAPRHNAVMYSKDIAHGELVRMGRCRSKCTREANEGLDDAYIEKAWKYADTGEIEDLAAELLGKAQEGQSIEDDLFCILYLAFRCGFKTAIGDNRTSTSE